MVYSGTCKKIITASWFLFILALISFPMETYPEVGITYADKIVHFFLFGIMAALLALTLSDHIKERKKYFAISALAASFYSGLCEIIQIYVPGRTSSFGDLAAGMAGAAAFLLLLYAIEERLKPKQAKKSKKGR